MSDDALIVVDVQNDFADPEGSLAVKNGECIVPRLNRHLRSWAGPVVFTQDWHPNETTHFDDWPKHCVAGTWGSRLHPDLFKPLGASYFIKGMENADDFSGFDGENVDVVRGWKREDLDEYLGKRHVTKVYIAGLATDYCVKATALDAVKKGFETHLLLDSIAAVNLKVDDDEKALKEMSDAGVLMR